MAARPAFKPWEIEDVIPNLEIDNANKDPYQVVFEDVHRAAYRNGSLANSVYAAKFQIGKFKYGEMVDFANKHFLSGNAVLYGANIDHETLKGYGSTHLDICQGGAVAPIKSPYKGGDWRRQAKSEWTHVLLAGEGAAGSDAKALATQVQIFYRLSLIINIQIFQAVLLTALGRSSNVPHDASVGAGLLSKSVGGSAAASAFQAVHADSSLAGIYIVAPVDHIEKAVRNAAQTIKNLKLSNLEAAKRRTVLDLLRASVHSAPQSLERTAQIFNSIDDRAILKAVEQVNFKNFSMF
ncbi:hypothetical protein WR25_03623 isoform B [Diploscapter pachys]|uniref:Peptidase M16 N-terminal domain-containing protein n=1 Tax=Diploscapter pachys TaxID=2018661 RepID=A0A2A2J251_9BILA|nr:hypothetical protein WR25_03623 isoform B [Diploscapter pachys]